MGLEPMTSVQYSTNWAIKPSGSWSVCEFCNIAVDDEEYKWIYERSYIWTEKKNVLIAQLVEHCTSIAEVMDLKHIQAWIFFRL